ncbi:MAG: IS4 family transposase, partial [Cyanobacteria bacterium J06648_10]
MRLSTLINSLQVHCHEQLKGRQVLAISDSSEINLQAHAGRLHPEGQGVVGNNRDIGFFIHPTMVVDRNSGMPLGLSTVQLWTRPVDRPSKEDRDYQSLPIE